MSRFVPVDPDTAYLLPPSVDEWFVTPHQRHQQIDQSLPRRPRPRPSPVCQADDLGRLRLFGNRRVGKDVFYDWLNLPRFHVHQKVGNVLVVDERAHEGRARLRRVEIGMLASQTRGRAAHAH